jgi:hypothetical protein
MRAYFNKQWAVLETQTTPCLLADNRKFWYSWPILLEVTAKLHFRQKLRIAEVLNYKMAPYVDT